MRKAYESNLDDQRLAEFEEQIDEAFDRMNEARHAVDNTERERLTDLACERAKARPRKLRRWVDPKVIREEARQWAEDRKRSYKEFLDNHFQAVIDSQGGKCAECGEPLDIYQQMLFAPPNMICDTCVGESMHPNNEGVRVL